MSLSDSDSELSELEALEELSDYSSSNSSEEARSYIRVDHFTTLNSQDFIFRFRLDKPSVARLLEEIYPHIQVQSARNHGVPPLHQLLLTLRFYALGTMLISVADFVGVSKATACRIVRNISCAIAMLYNKYIYIHNETAEGFYNIARFPRVLGAVDGTHVRIQSPCSRFGEEFRNRKGYFSMNVQGVCNADLLFMNVVARWPGSSHDATIFNNSVLRAECEDRKFGNRWLLGDSAYPSRSYLLTPLLHPQTQAEVLYNEAHIRTRNCIERTFGVWKRRFPVVSLTLRLSLNRLNSVIIATAVLHNIARLNCIDDVPPEVEIPPAETEDNNNNLQDHHNNQTERERLILDYFANLP